MSDTLFEARVVHFRGSAMGRFLGSWKRMLGCITLTVAVLFAVAWVRSQYIQDYAQFYLFNHGFSVSSQLGYLGSFFSWNTRGEVLSYSDASWDSFWIDLTKVTPIDRSDSLTHWLGFKYAELRIDPIATRNIVLPYWSLVLPLTALSAWLLLSKRRQPTFAKRSPESTELP